jgi:hypothetical protein
MDYAWDDGSTTMAISRSTDAGASWSALKPIKLERRGRAPVHGHHGDLIVMPDGRLRLYFADPGQGRRKGRAPAARRATLVRSAVSQDGMRYRLDARTRVVMRSGHRGNRPAEAHPTTILLGGDLHLFGQSLAARNGNRTQHLLSRQGQRFARLRPVRIPEVTFVGSMVAVGDGIRAYVSTEYGVASAISKDSRQWVLEEGIRVRNGWDPAVARLKDGSFLMLYCARMDEPFASSSQMVLVDADLSADGFLAEGSVGAPGAPGDVDELGGGGAAGGGGLAAESDGDDVTEEQVGESSDDAEAVVLHDGPRMYPSVDENGYVSVPDFQIRVDYFQWFCVELIGDPADNAYFAYDTFMPGLGYQKGSRPGWPSTLNDMFNGGTHQGPPAPWDPAEHPEWEATHEAVQDLLDQFRTATRHGGYAMPVDDEYRAHVADPEGEIPLINLILPQLSSHRAMVKATLADAWRLEDGRVSSDRMLDAWETSLRDAEHLNQGPTLIEELVSMANRAFVHKNARWALKEDVFSGDELEAALDTLTEYDIGNRDTAIAIRGERAFTLDTMQYLYWPKEPGGEPAFREDRVTDFFDFSESAKAELRQLSGDDVYASVESFDEYYRELGDEMSIGYPDVRGADISETHAAHVKTNALNDFLLPNLSRVHKLRARLEASRRATQLAYATHLFKDRTGRWPETLDELPGRYGYEMTIDPFTGGQFGYRVDGGEPKIYSLSENGIDDGGAHASRWDDDAEENGGSDDHVFWPPQPRN